MAIAVRQLKRNETTKKENQLLKFVVHKIMRLLPPTDA